MAGGSLALVQEKLDWAGHHLETLELKIQAFKDLDPIPCVADYDTETGEKFWRVDGVPLEPAKELSFIAGDFLANLRATLDYLVWQLVLENRGTPDRRNAFPICTEPADWPSALGRKRLRAVSDEAIAAIKDLQPCFGRNPFRNQWIGWIDDLAGIDKHRHLHLFTAGTEGGFFLPGLPVHVSGYSIWRGRVENGTELARVGGENADVDFAPAVGVAFRAGGPASNESVRETFYGTRDLVQVIVEEFAGFFT